MSGVELKVVLVGGDEQEQRAFNRPFEDQDRAAAHTFRPTKPADVPRVADAANVSPPATTGPADVPRVADVMANASAAAPRPGTAQPDGTSNQAINSVEELVQKIQELITLELATKTQPKPSQPAGDDRPNTMFGRLVDRIDRFVSSTERAIAQGARRIGGKRFGNAVGNGMTKARSAARSAGQAIAKTRIGRTAISGARAAGRFAGSAARKVAATRAGQAVVGMFARTAATGAAGSAAGAGAGAAGAAGAGAAGAAALGPVGVAAGVAAVALTGAALTVKAFADAVHNAAGDLQELSPELSGVRAQQDVRRQLQMLDRADRLGPKLAEIEAARGRVAESAYEIQTKIYEVLLEFTPFYKALLDGVNIGARKADVFAAEFQVFMEDMKDKLGDKDPQNNKDAQEALKKSIEGLENAIKEAAKSGDDFNGIDPFLAQVLQMPGPGMGNNPPPMPPNIPGNFP